MAAKHLEFNGKGHELVKRLIADYNASGKNHELAPGMQAVYNEIHADLIRRATEVQGMIAAYK